MKKPPFYAVLAYFMACGAQAEEVPFSSERWIVEGAEFRVEQFEGREALFLNNAIARLEDVRFENGTIEYDTLLPSDARGFSGIYWRMRDQANGEDFYIRHHQGGNPDANQYTPLFNGSSAWQLYHGPRFAYPSIYRFGEWMHVKIVARDGEADIYIDSDEPTLHVKLKNDVVPGSIAIRSAFAPAWFSRFSFVAEDEPEITGQPATGLRQPPAGIIEKWQVSNPFPEQALEDVFELDGRDHEWSTLETEDEGYANLARVQGASREANTVFARISINAEEPVSRSLAFGYSDRVKVFLNRQLVYSGNNTYQSRDYRYLGTVGLFDSVPLRLARGRNELWFAVSESFGGWGIMAAIENRAGLRITP